MDRNDTLAGTCRLSNSVALRKESVDRNGYVKWKIVTTYESLSARRAWIEIPLACTDIINVPVALRKESVDRN